MGLVQDVHAAVTRYAESASAAATAATDLAGQLDALTERLSAHGPLGASADPELALARSRLAAARQRLSAAAEAADASGSRAQLYANRAFPPG